MRPEQGCLFCHSCWEVPGIMYNRILRINKLCTTKILLGNSQLLRHSRNLLHCMQHKSLITVFITASTGLYFDPQKSPAFTGSWRKFWSSKFQAYALPPHEVYNQHTWCPLRPGAVNILQHITSWLYELQNTISTLTLKIRQHLPPEWMYPVIRLQGITTQMISTSKYTTTKNVLQFLCFQLAQKVFMTEVYVWISS